MSTRASLPAFNLLAFDPGSAATGWAWFAVDFRAFSRPDNDLYEWINTFDYGEFVGTHFEIVKQCVALVDEMHAVAPFLSKQVLSEDFELTQSIGGSDLLSPLRIKSVIEWHCHSKQISYVEQQRGLRLHVTKQGLKDRGFDCRRIRKDEFAAMQHAVTCLERMKADARKLPWMLPEADALNAGGWDCACRTGADCDINHPPTRR